jgi:hypothetical protein
MRLRSVLTFIALLFTCTLYSQNFTHYPDDPLIRYTGRFDRSLGKDGYYYSFPGSEIRFRFTGTKLSVYLMQNSATAYADAYVDIRIDDRFKDSLRVKNKDWNTIFTSDSPETHTVSIISRTEPWMGEILFAGLELNGRLETPETLSPRKILFSGASLETGYGNLASLDFETSKKTEGTFGMMNSYYSYPAMTARDLGAQHICACYGGKGLLRDYQGDTIKQLPELFFETTVGNPGEKQNMQEFVPDIIVFDLGGNDFETGIPDKKKFTDKYIWMIDTARHLYPHAHIIIAEIFLYPDAIVSDSTYIKTTRDYNQTIYDHFRSAGDKQVYYWNYSETGIQKWGQAAHPSVETYRKISESLNRFITDNTGIHPLEITREEKNKVTLFPNPSETEINLEGLKRQSWSIINSTGITILHGNDFPVTISGLDAGLYILKTSTGNFSFVKQ